MEYAVDYQVLFNSAFGVLLIILGWGMRALFDSINDLRKTDKEIQESVNDIAVSLPSKYVPKEDLKELTAALFKKLDRIEVKLDAKADK